MDAKILLQVVFRLYNARLKHGVTKELILSIFFSACFLNNFDRIWVKSIEFEISVKSTDPMNVSKNGKLHFEMQ